VNKGKLLNIVFGFIPLLIITAFVCSQNSIEKKAWEKSYPINKGEGVTKITTMSNGNILVSGIALGKDHSLHHLCHLWILNIDKYGSILWRKEYPDVVYPTVYYPESNILSLPHNEFIVVGGIKDNKGNINASITKFNKDGVEIWHRHFTDEHNSSCFTSIAQNTKDGIFISGVKEKEEGVDLWLLKLNNNGDLLWQYDLGSRHSKEFPHKLDMENAMFYIAGRKDYELWVNVLDANLNSLWEKFNGHWNDDYPYISILPSIDDASCVFLGLRRSRGRGFKWENVLIKYDKNGNTKWEKIIQATYCSSVASTYDDGLLISGKSQNHICLFKYSGNGVFEWSDSISIDPKFRSPIPLKLIKDKSYLAAYLHQNKSDQLKLIVKYFTIDE
jgi:hypothetical protein